MTPPLYAVIALYGHLHVPFAAACIESLAQASGVTRVILVHAEVAGLMLDRLVAPYGDFVHPYLLRGGAQPVAEQPRAVRVARKLLAWEDGAHFLVAEAVARGLWLDADTLAVGDLTAILPPPPSPFVLAVTRRPGRWPYNSGVVAAPVTTRTLDLFMRWRSATEVLLQSPAVVQQAAIDAYGALDQAALAQVLDYCVAHHYPVLELPSSVWNMEDRETAETHGVRIFHFKGSLPELLAPPGPRLCEPAFALWRRMYADHQVRAAA